MSIVNTPKKKKYKRHTDIEKPDESLSTTTVTTTSRRAKQWIILHYQITGGQPCNCKWTYGDLHWLSNHHTVQKLSGPKGDSYWLSSNDSYWLSNNHSYWLSSHIVQLWSWVRHRETRSDCQVISHSSEAECATGWLVVTVKSYRTALKLSAPQGDW